jgi:hypothetical protein
MGLFKKKNAPPALSREEALDCIPLISAGVRASRTPEGIVRLRYPLAVKPWLAELARRFGGPTADQPPSRQLELDELGSLTWDLMDGKRSVRRIVHRFAKETEVHPKEAEVAVTHFLRALGRRGIVGMAMPSERQNGSRV